MIAKKVTCFAICLSIMIGMLGGCSAPQSSSPAISPQQPGSDTNTVSEAIDLVLQAEYDRAQAYGLIPEGWSDTLEQSLTHKEFCALAAQMIQLAKPENLAVWTAFSQTAAESDAVMGRDDAAVGLLHAAQALDICYVNVGDYSDLHRVEQNPDSWAFDINFPLWPELSDGFQMLQQTPGSPVGSEFYHESWGDTISTAFWFVLMRTSLINERPLLDYDENYSLRMGEDLTRGEAITAILRLGESESNLLENNRYISVYEQTAYDSSIITDELLHSSSTLPEPSHNELPSNWNGIGISKNKDTVGAYYRDFQEAEIAFLAENGFNFTRVFFNFHSLRYPDFPEDLSLVNEQELRELDQLIAWGMEYDVHIQLSANDTLKGDRSFDLNDEEWELFRVYWEALAKRYVGIPSRYLSFDLANEIQPSPENVSSAVGKLGEVVNCIRDADSDRVLLLSFNDNPWIDWVKGVASLGLSLGYHAYRPTYISKGDQYYYAPGDVIWPYPYFSQILSKDDALRISGDIGGKTLRIDFWVYSPFRVAFDDGSSFAVDVPGDYVHEDSCGARFYEPYSIQIPDSVSSVTLQPIDMELSIQEIGLENGTDSRWLIPHDEMIGDSRGGGDLIWQDDTGWSSETNYTAELVYQDLIQPIQKVAADYDVGFMINEYGSYAGDLGWDVAVKADYDGDMAAMLEEHGISWCMCELDYMADFFGEPFNEWENTVVKTYSHTSDDGHKHTFEYSEDLLNVYRQHTK